MKNFKLSHGLLAGGIVIAGAIGLIAADHVDSPSVASTSSDIADFFAFEGSDANSTVFIATVQGPLTPGTSTENARFDENVMIEINIDNTGDFQEDLVIQAVRRGDKMYFTGPIAPAQQGKTSIVSADAVLSSVDISSGANVVSATAPNGMKMYAGPRRDPFFFDLARFNAIASGSAAPAGFLPAGQSTDFFANLNVLAVTVEVPNSLLGAAPAHVGGAVGITGLPNAYNVWVSTKRKS